jgi:hypothetical protein
MLHLPFSTNLVRYKVYKVIDRRRNHYKALFLKPSVVEWLQVNKCDYVLAEAVVHRQIGEFSASWHRAGMYIDFIDPSQEMLFKLTWL